MNLDKIQEELMNEIDQEERLNQDIDNWSQAIASSLLISKKARADINDTIYSFVYKEYTDKENKRGISLIAIDEFHYKMANGKYRPFTATCEYNEDITLKDNLACVVEGFLRHVLNAYKAEELSD